jgi:tyrosine-protein phosphatase YwqE
MTKDIIISTIQKVQELFDELLSKYEEDELSLDIEYGGSQRLTRQEVEEYKQRFQQTIRPIIQNEGRNRYR